MEIVRCRGWLRVALLSLVLCLAAGRGALADFASAYAALEAGDHDRAAREMRAAAESGDAQAQYFLGVMHVHGIGIGKGADRREGLRWLTVAAEGGHVQAQIELARTYQSGEHGVAADHAAAANWYRRAAEQGDVGAQLMLADSYAFGRGVTQDLKQAYVWYLVAGEYWGDLIAGARTLVAQGLSPAEIEDARRRAQALLAKTRR